ncbi:MAG TPA: MBL fold metallo-hydrolase [Gaiellaceae bacterium]|nr:MBL fold metallo-hydrolase [Gaiellaceae bacterium]
MRLTVIGSSPAWPNPGSAQSGYLVETPGSLLLDCGPGVLGRLRETGILPAIDAVAITHFHLDHWGDLVPWAWLAAYGTESLDRPQLWLPPEGIAQLETFASLWGNPKMFERAFTLREFEAGRAFEAAGFEVEPRRVRHYQLRAFGFRVRDGSGRLLAYSGDAGPGDDLRELARGADLFLCEATLADAGREGEPRGHLAADEAIAASDGTVLLTHRPVELPPPDGVALARDGLVVEV